MKHVVLVASLVILATMTAFAEDPFTEGTFMLSGQMYCQNLSGDVYGASSQTAVGLAPRVGWFVSPSLVVSGEVDLLYQSTHGYSQTSFVIGPRLAYFFTAEQARPEVKGSFYPYIAGLMTFGVLTATRYESESIIKFGGDLGALLMISNSVAADISLRVTRDRYSATGLSASGTAVQFGAGLTGFIF